MPYIDAHNHLSHSTLEDQVDSILLDCRLQNIEYLLVNSTCPTDWPIIQSLAQSNRSILPHYGVHPWFCDRLPSNWMSLLEHTISKLPCAIGEVGLDGTQRAIQPEQQQEEVFCYQLGLSREHNLPICIHGTRRWHRVLEIVRQERSPRCGMLLHAFSGDINMVNQFVDLGAYFTVSPRAITSVTSKTDTLIRAIPLDRLLLETDSPHQPIRSVITKELPSTNRHSIPSDIITLYTLLADRLQIPLDALQQTLSMNFHTLYKTAFESHVP
jgi:TatD DNase family protein